MNTSEVLAHYEKKTILVTGGAGCIGSNIVRTLLTTRPKRIVVIDDLSSSYKWNLPKDPKVVFIEGSILDQEKVLRAFSYHPDYVFHLAAHFANQNSVEHPKTDVMVNVVGTLEMLQYAHLMGVERFVFASSGCSVYGSNAPLPLEEEYMTLHLDTPYQINKLVGELYCNYFRTYYDLPTAITRYFNVYGPGEVPGKYRNVIPNFMWRAMNNLPLNITGTGDETRDFTYIGDIVDGTLRMGVIPKAIGEAINLASGTETKIVDLANHINQLTGNTAEIQFVPKREWDLSTRRCASINKAKTILGCQARTPIEEGLKQVHQWFKNNWNHIVASVKD